MISLVVVISVVRAAGNEEADSHAYSKYQNQS